MLTAVLPRERWPLASPERLTCIISFNSHINPMDQHWYCPHFTEGETEAQNICLRLPCLRLDS